ncbi:PREDICTED: uncharacterized protein LOC108512456 [Rhinopithecus bieti]|uniref:uncharacterized protein LOC108512456 n=1 Tax=Rhinopithecus bieti TaxID=61621 RepID=UPI00083C409C|nr:PREDICTED: uncharacterized protein LOC108512456 [Rhinopithecus bieti]
MMGGDNVLAALAGSGRLLRLGVHSGHAPEAPQPATALWGPSLGWRRRQLAPSTCGKVWRERCGGRLRAALAGQRHSPRWLWAPPPPRCPLWPRSRSPSARHCTVGPLSGLAEAAAGSLYLREGVEGEVWRETARGARWPATVPGERGLGWPSTRSGCSATAPVVRRLAPGPAAEEVALGPTALPACPHRARILARPQPPPCGAGIRTRSPPGPSTPPRASPVHAAPVAWTTQGLRSAGAWREWRATRPTALRQDPLGMRKKLSSSLEPTDDTGIGRWGSEVNPLHLKPPLPLFSTRAA